jgi:catecholate siderophore receptor
MPCYFRLDKTWRAQLNIENLFDTSYYATADGNNNITPGSPRAFRAVGDGELLRLSKSGRR